MTPLFHRLLDLAKRTGDRLIITDQDGKNAFVVMDLVAYEKLLSLRSFQDDNLDFPNASPFEGNGEPDFNGKDDIPNEMKEAVKRDLALIKSWEDQKEKDSAQQSGKDPNGRGDEDRFYLEPVE